MAGLSALPAYPEQPVVCAHLRVPPDYMIHGTPVASPEGQSGGILTAGCAADPRGPWLRSEFCCLGPSQRTRTPSASLAGTARFHRCTAYTRGLRCAGAPRRPARPSRPSLARCPHVPPTLPRRVRWPLPLSTASEPGFLELQASRHPQPRLCQQCLTGVPFEAASFALGCGPCVCPALLAGYDGAPAPPAEVPCHSRFRHWPSPTRAGSQARWANGKPPIVETCTRLVTSGSAAAP
jgi:hypothetical protein